MVPMIRYAVNGQQLARDTAKASGEVRLGVVKPWSKNVEVGARSASQP